MREILRKKGFFSFLILIAIILQIFMPVIVNAIENKSLEVDLEDEVSEGEKEKDFQDEEELVDNTTIVNTEEENSVEEKEDSIEGEVESQEDKDSDSKETEDIETEISKEEKDLGNIFTSIDILDDERQSLIDESEADNITIEIEDGSNIVLVYEWEISDDVQDVSGSYSEIEIPEIFQELLQDENIVGNILWGDLDIGEYELIDSKILRLTFNDELENYKERKGSVGIEIDINVQKIEGELEEIIKIGEEVYKEYVIKIKGDRTYDINKKANIINNNKEIEWEIVLNESKTYIDKGQIIDIIPDGLELKKDSITIFVEDEKEYDDSKVSISEDKKEIKIDFEKTNKTYTIKYITSIENLEKQPFKNVAEFNYDDDKSISSEAEVDGIVQKDPLSKSGNWNNEKDEIEWEIKINESQEFLTNAVLTDKIPEGLSLIEDSFEVKKQTDNGNEIDEELKKFEIEILESNGFKIDFGDIDGKTYIIKYKTSINEEEKYKEISEFTNEATLDYGEDKITKSDTIKIQREEWMSKTGKEMENYGEDERIIEWTVDINKRKAKLESLKLVDELGKNLKLVEDSIEINMGGEKLIEDTDYSWEKTEKGFDLVFKHTIEDHLILTYKTIIDNSGNIEDSNEDLKNKITLYANKSSVGNGEGTGGNGNSGDGGSGTGSEEEYDIKYEVESDAPQELNNDYHKSTVENKIIDGENYNGIDYENKTMSWVIRIDAKKEKIDSLEIQDIFNKEEMILLENTVKVLKNGNKIEEGYSLIQNDNGFVINFAEGLEREKYEIYFKTSFDPNKINKLEKEEKTYTNTYKNKAIFTINKKEEKESSAEYKIIDSIYNTGNKKGHINKNNREIDWEIFINALSQNLGKNVVIEDKLSEGQEIIEDSFIITPFELDKSGEVVLGEVLSSEDYDLKINMKERTFQINFKIDINSGYKIEYKTRMEGLSKEKYSNTASVKGNNYEKEFEATIDYSEYDQWISKNLTNHNTSDGKIPEGSRLEWEVKINNSLSEIKNPIFIDEISEGHIYELDSFEVYMKDKKNEFKEIKIDKDVYEDYLNIEEGFSEKGLPVTRLNFELGKLTESGLIEDSYIIRYNTLVIASSGKISNNAKLVGVSTEKSTESSIEIDVKAASWASGSGVRRKGNLKIVKIDGETDELLEGAEFELYREKDGNKVYEKFVVEDGNIWFKDLEYGSYKLKEVKAPKGYKKVDKIIDLAIYPATMNENVLELKIENFRLGSLKVKKIDKANKKILPGAEFELTNKDTKEKHKFKTDAEGVGFLENLERGEYVLRETKAPKGYKLDNRELEIKIDKENLDIEIEVENELIPIKPEEPNNPGKPINPPTNPKDPNTPDRPDDPKNPDESEKIQKPNIIKEVDQNKKNFSLGERVVYNIKVEIPESIESYDKISIKDTLDERLEIIKVIVTTGDSNITIDYKIEDQSVILELNRKQIEKLSGQILNLEIWTQINDKAINNDIIENKATLNLNNKYELESNIVEIVVIDEENIITDYEDENKEKEDYDDVIEKDVNLDYKKDEEDNIKVKETNNSNYDDKKDDIETKNTFLPKTGEKDTTIYMIVGVLFIIVGIYFYKKNNN